MPPNFSSTSFSCSNCCMAGVLPEKSRVKVHLSSATHLLSSSPYLHKCTIDQSAQKQAIAKFLAVVEECALEVYACRVSTPLPWLRFCSAVLLLCSAVLLLYSAVLLSDTHTALWLLYLSWCGAHLYKGSWIIPSLRRTSNGYAGSVVAAVTDPFPLTTFQLEAPKFTTDDACATAAVASTSNKSMQCMLLKLNRRSKSCSTTSGTKQYTACALPCSGESNTAQHAGHLKLTRAGVVRVDRVIEAVTGTASLACCQPECHCRCKSTECALLNMD